MTVVADPGFSKPQPFVLTQLYPQGNPTTTTTTSCASSGTARGQLRKVGAFNPTHEHTHIHTQNLNSVDLHNYSSSSSRPTVEHHTGPCLVFFPLPPRSPLPLQHLVSISSYMSSQSGKGAAWRGEGHALSIKKKPGFGGIIVHYHDL